MASFLRRVHAPAALKVFTTRPRFFSSKAPLTGRSFQDAVTLLDTLQTNKQVVKSLSTSGRDANAAAIPEMLNWLRKAGYTPDDFTGRLKFIHVAGTKGKGSVCAMVESILLQYRREYKRSQNGGLGVFGKVGMYTSPHLTTVRERIRIDGNPISESIFARYFFDLWDRFNISNSTEVNAAPNPSAVDKPNYFRYLTILALHTFMQEGVESAIIECGIGGEYDSTTILPRHGVTTTAITSLGLDHVGMLGDTIEEIAWHKSGILRKGVPAFTGKQSPEAQAALEQRASEKGVDLVVVEPSRILTDVKLGLEGDFQRENAAIAISVAASHLGKLGVSYDVPLPGPSAGTFLPGKFIAGLESVAWPGRCQVLKDGDITWFLDGAHTTESLRLAAAWFHGHLLPAFVGPNPPTGAMLMFCQTERDGAALLRDLMTALYKSRSGGSVGVIYPRSSTVGHATQRLGRSIFTYAAFPTRTPLKLLASQEKADIRSQKQLASIYQSLDGNALHMAYETIEEAVELAKRVSKGNERLLVLVTGSLHLVGGVLQVLEHLKVNK